MADCNKCKNVDKCEAWDFERKKNKGCSTYEPKLTNADKIRSMSDEELAGLTITYVDGYGHYICSDESFFYERKEAIEHEIKWLQSEAE